MSSVEEPLKSSHPAVVLMGMSGAGKTWFMDQALAMHPGVFTAVSQTKSTIKGGFTFTHNWEYHKEALPRALKTGKVVIVDRNHLTRSHRASVRNATEGKILFVVFSFPRMVLERNISHRFKTQFGSHPITRYPEMVPGLLDWQEETWYHVYPDELRPVSGDEIVYINNHPDMRDLLGKLPTFFD